MVLRLAIRPARKTSGVEVRRGTFDVVVDGERVGSSELHDTFEAPVEPGRRTPKIRNGRNSSRTATFEAAEGEIVAFYHRDYSRRSAIARSGLTMDAT